MIPHEFYVIGICLPPLLVAATIGVVLAGICARILNKYDMAKYFCFPTLIFIALAVIFTLVLNYVFLPF